MRHYLILFLILSSLVATAQIRSKKVHSWRASQRSVYQSINQNNDTLYSYSFHASEYSSLEINATIVFMNQNKFFGFIDECDSLMNQVKLEKGEFLSLDLKCGNHAQLSQMFGLPIVYVWDNDRIYSSIIDWNELKNLKKAREKIVTK
jgi:hypothetical protein